MQPKLAKLIYGDIHFSNITKLVGKKRRRKYRPELKMKDGLHILKFNENSLMKESDQNDK